MRKIVLRILLLIINLLSIGVALVQPEPVNLISASAFLILSGSWLWFTNTNAIGNVIIRTIVKVVNGIALVFVYSVALLIMFTASAVQIVENASGNYAIVFSKAYEIVGLTEIEYKVFFLVIIGIITVFEIANLIRSLCERSSSWEQATKLNIR